MKKAIALLLSVLLLMSTLAACGTKPSTETPENTAPTQTETTQPEPTPEPAGPDTSEPDPLNGSVIFEKDGVKVTTAGLDYDPTDLEPTPIIWLDIENTGDEDVYLGVDHGSVNGFMTTVVLADFYEEGGMYTSASYDFDVTVPAGETIRRALTYYHQGVNDETLGEIEFSFTTAPDEYSWRDYVSDPVTLVTGETVEPVDIRDLGEVVFDDGRLVLVLGNQDYEDWFGPVIDFYAENKTDSFFGLWAETAEADGVFCDYLYSGTVIAPGKKVASQMSFDGELRELKGFEKLTVNFILSEADTADELNSLEGAALDPVSATYPPQVWGEYENGGLTFTVRPRINDLITVETPENDENGILFTVSETASLEAGGYDGAGWLFSIGAVDAETLHEMLCSDMSGVEVFSKDEEGRYYLYYHPTDVRYERATAEELERDQDQWTTLCRWAEDVPELLQEENGMDYVGYTNTPVDMYLARAAWDKDAQFTLSTTEFGPVDGAGVDGTPFAEQVLHGYFYEAEDAETPDGEYAVLAFPDEDVRLDFFFFAEGDYVRLVSGDSETLYQAAWTDDAVPDAEVMRGWYYAAAEKAGLKQADDSLAPYFGDWHESIAGRGTLSVSSALAPGKVRIEARWPESAAVVHSWTLVAALEDDRLVYAECPWEITEYDEDGEHWTLDSGWDASGWFRLGSAGELIWHDDLAEGGEDSAFVK